MMWTALALAAAAQAGPAAFITDPAFLAAYTDWARCTNAAVDAGADSDRREREVVAAAHAACPTEEAAVRATIVAAVGEARGAREMDRLRASDRDALADRVRRRRADSRGAQALIRAWISCLLRRVESAAADAPEAQAVEAAFVGCPTEEEALRRLAESLGDADRGNAFIRAARAANRDDLLAHLRERRARASAPR